MFDLLSGALAGRGGRWRTYRLPVSLHRPAVRVGSKWRLRPFTAPERAEARRLLADAGLSPYALARRQRPATFVDVVHRGSTFTELFTLLRAWIAEEHEAWDVIRRNKLRFVGVTSRGKTSPNTFRWQQHAPWTRQLPARSILNVSLDPWVWSYFGDHQIKLTRWFRPERWLADAEPPDRDPKTRQALAEAVAIVAHGRSAHGRKALTRAIDGEPTLAQPWLRSLIALLNNNG
jgi:hypothetical protein